MKLPWVLGLLLPVVLASTAPAAELAGVSLPDELEVRGRKLVLNGLGLREATLFRVDVYVAGLYLERESPDAAAILDSDEVQSIRMVFLRKVKRESILEAWEEGFEKNAGSALDGMRDRIGRLGAWMPDFASGDTLGFDRLPGEGVLVRVRGEEVGALEGADFARVLWSIWLGPAPPNPGLKQGMLGLD